MSQSGSEVDQSSHTEHSEDMSKEDSQDSESESSGSDHLESEESVESAALNPAQACEADLENCLILDWWISRIEVKEPAEEERKQHTGYLRQQMEYMRDELEDDEMPMDVEKQAMKSIRLRSQSCSKFLSSPSQTQLCYID